MNKEILLQLFKASYIRQNFIDNVIVPVFKGKVASITIYENNAAVPIRLTDSEAEFVKSAVKYGEIITADELPRTIELYEVIVGHTKQIERSRVGLNALVKKHIIGDNAVMVNFAYDKPENRSWRFSFIARDGIFQDGEMKVVDTNPKRYTYVFGQPDETFKTAIDRFTTLANEFEITINKIKDAFSVEAMSKAFFDDYRDVHYAGFVDYLMRSNFLRSAFNGKDKDVRDFVKKLLGRIVFLYFLQKKGWMGASNSEYKNGDKNFISNYFKQSGADDAFYPNWLTKLFFEALNNPRTNDDFVLPNGKTVKVPYLNGGLFEKQSENYDFLTFPAEMFDNLFNFFDQYNFTIFEDSPEEHTVAVDPEMLGHIFENLLEDNKDKGAFYTPKDIVHYMTQESLIEYLHTQLPDADKNELEAFIKNKPSNLSNDIKTVVGAKLDTVKICDPAIGSGAFPMGLLQEIYSIKERIAFDLNLPWDNTQAAVTKANIIQNSIYGVDIERGAVDIARLRFWLSLIVDEEKPKSLPNLDYKIVVGNSLLSKFEDTVIEIDWSLDTTKEGFFGQELAEEKITLLKKISQKQNQYFLAENNEKPKLKAEINQLKIDILIKELQLMIETIGFNQESMQGLNKKQLAVWQQTQDWKAALSKLKQLKVNSSLPFNHFDWKLNFPEVLNPLVNEKCGFDIVIGNPPYGAKVENQSELKRIYSETSFGNSETYKYFFNKGVKLVNHKGYLAFITSDSFYEKENFLDLREFLLSKSCFIKAIKLGDDVFKEVNLPTAISFIKLDISTLSEVFYLDFSKVKVKEYEKNKLIDIDVFSDKHKRFFIPQKKILNSKTFNLIDNYDQVMGVKVYQKGKGKPKQTEYEINENLYISDTKKGNEWLEYIDSGIKRYRYDGSIKYIKYGEWLAEPRKINYFNVPKIVLREIINPSPFATIIPGLTIVKNTNAVIVNKTKKYSLEYLLGILNSRFFNYYIQSESPKSRNKLFPSITSKLIKNFPVAEGNKISNRVIEIIVIVLLKLYKSYLYKADENTNNYFYFLEEIIDALVFELYFSEDFKEKNIEIAKHAEELFKPLEGLTEEEQLAKIEEVYSKYRAKSNPLRNQIKLMKIELSELLLPILSI